MSSSQHGPADAGPSIPLTPASARHEPLPVAESTSPAGLSPKIRALGEKPRHEDQWSRTPNTTGTGAIHVRSFHAKLTEDALNYMDQAINEWLDAHPQYEVKFVTSTVGVLTGKLKEPHLICQVWV
jgi:hypothetical protein